MKGKGMRAEKVTERGKGRAYKKVGGMPLGTLLSSFHTMQQESGCWAGTGNGLWKSLQWHFLTSTRKSSSSEGNSALYPKNSIAWSQCRPGLRLTGDETEQHKVPKVVSLYKTVTGGAQGS